MKRLEPGTKLNKGKVVWLKYTVKSPRGEEVVLHTHPSAYGIDEGVLVDWDDIHVEEQAPSAAVAAPTSQSTSSLSRN